MLATVILIAVFGLVMIALEVIVPGGLLGVIGAVAIGTSLVLTATSPALDSIGANGRFALGTGIMLGGLIMLVLWLKFFTRAKFVKRHLLEGEIDGTQEYEQYKELLDKTGTAETDLRPSGKARLDGRKRDVLAETGMIERGTNVKVVKVEGSRVIVRAVN